MAARCWALFLLAVSISAQVAPDQNTPATLAGETFSVKGHIAGLAYQPSRYSVSATVAERFGWTPESGKISPNGDFVLDNLPPGQHELRLLENGPNGQQILGQTEVFLSNQDLTNIAIVPFKSAELQVRVMREGEDAPLTSGSVFLIPVEATKFTHYGVGAFQPQDGTYLLNDVPPGKYRIGFNNAADCYLKAVESAGKELNPDAIDIPEDANLSLLLTYSPNVAGIAGEVEVSKDRAPNSVHVFLIAEDDNSPYEHVRPIDIDQSFHFSVQHLRPAKYLLFATEEENSEAWDNAEFVKALAPEGAELELQEKQQAAVHLKLIPKGDTDRIKRQLGL